MLDKGTWTFKIQRGGTLDRTLVFEQSSDDGATWAPVDFTGYTATSTPAPTRRPATRTH